MPTARTRVARTLRGAALAVAALLVAGIPGCEGDTLAAPPQGLEHSRASRTCGPADGAATAIYLAGAPVTALEPAAPYVRVDIWAGITQITQQDWSLTGAQAAGAASYFSSASTLEAATAGQLHIETVNADSSIEGSITLQFPTAGAVAGGFRASWLSRAVNCGV